MEDFEACRGRATYLLVPVLFRFTPTLSKCEVCWPCKTEQLLISQYPTVFCIGYWQLKIELKFPTKI